VRQFARFKRLKAKNDKIDARLIALATTQTETVKAANDPRLADLAQRMTAYEQAADHLARMKTEAEHIRLPDVRKLFAATIVIRMPELGSLKHGQAAALIGVAPFDRDSGLHRGQRFIWGGRERPRRMLYIAAVVAKRFDPALKAFAANLAQRGKPPKIITVAVMRKLIEAANLVLGRGQPWTKATAA